MEFATDPLIETIWQAQKNCYLPVLAEEEKTLHFVLYEKSDNLIPNRYHIPEPAGKNFFPPTQLDCVFLPLTAFDRQGNRIGSGAGYYDRTFEFLKKTRIKPILIGLGYASQQVAELPQDAWDLSLDGILTEKELLFF